MTDQPTFSTPRFQIFPAVGLARVGNSMVHTYIAAESPQIDHVPTDGYYGFEPIRSLDRGQAIAEPFPVPFERRIKRMGCRFRVFEFALGGTASREVTANDADIEWRVHLVNKKAAGIAGWGLGMPTETDDLNPHGPPFGITEADLTIDPGEHTISGVQAGPVQMTGQIMSGRPQAIDVKLGDLKTDDAGRLVIYGGHGAAGSWLESPPEPDRIRNAGWYDDTSDGIVTATVTTDDGVFEALAARVIVGPPDYAHPCLAMVTLFDLAMDRSGVIPDLDQMTTSFRHDLHPMLHRAAFLEWTLFSIESGKFGRMAKHGHGYTGNHDMHPDGAFLERHIIDSIRVVDEADSSFQEGERRRGLFLSMLKVPGAASHGGQGEFNSMPPIEGLTLTEVQYRHFANLQALAFTDDWPADRSPVKLDQPDFDDVPVADQPAAMNRAAMDFAVGGPFYPGVEIGGIAAEETSWVTVDVRDEKAAFRIADGVGPGDLTQSLALPWQTAFNQHYYRTDDPTTAADNLWPSARPVRVPAKRGGTSDDLMWTRPFTQRTGANDFEEQKMPRNSQMIENWSKLGFLVPATFYIEADRPLAEDGPLTM